MSQENYSVEVLSKEIGNFDLSFKIIIIGDPGVGKSCLSIRADRNLFETLYSPTIGFEFFTYFIKVDDKPIKLQIWNAGGEEVYRSLITLLYANSSLAIVVYSIDNEDSFNNLEFWLNELKMKANKDINIFLIGNKADLEDERKITEDMGKQFAEANKIKLFLETSAKTGFNVQEIYIEAAKLLYEQHLKIKEMILNPKYSEQKESEIKLNDDNNNNEELEEENEKSEESFNGDIQNQTNEVKELKEDLYKKENEQLKSNLEKYQKENEQLKKDLFKANKIISVLKNYQDDNDELKSLRDENNNLKYELNVKENEIKDLKDKIHNNVKEDMKANYKDIRFVTFISMDSMDQCGIKCLSKDTFAEIEEKRNKKNDNLKNNDDVLTVNIQSILRFEKIKENNIKNGDIFQLYKLK